MTFADAVLIASLVLLGLLALITAIGLLLTALWWAAGKVASWFGGEPYEYQPLYLVTREDR